MDSLKEWVRECWIPLLIICLATLVFVSSAEESAQDIYQSCDEHNGFTGPRGYYNCTLMEEK
jgi:hypothetical protein